MRGSDEWPSEITESTTMAELLVGALTALPSVAGLDALRTSRQVVELLTGARWHMMRQAREEGASWSDIGQALGMTRQAAHDFYRRKIEQQERHPGRHDTARSRAVLDKAELDEETTVDG
jgi:hypothetical protein